MIEKTSSKAAKAVGDGARSVERLQELIGDLSLVGTKIITLPPVFCKVDGGPEIHIKLTGTSLNLDGFGYPADGQGLHFSGTLTVIPPTPGAASSSLPSAALTDLGYNAGTGSWTLELNDVAGSATRTRTVVIWHRYFNPGNE